MKYFITSLLVILIGSCNLIDNKDVAQDTESVLSGEIINLENNYVLYRMSDTIELDYDTVWLNNQNEFNLTFNLINPKYLYLKAGDLRLSFYLKPDDSINFAADYDEFFKTIRLNARKSGVYNDYLMSFYKMKYDSEEVLYKIFSSPEKIAVHMIDSIKNQQLNRFESFKKGFGRVDEKFVFFENQRIIYEWAYNRCIYPKYFKYLNRQFNFETSPDFKSYQAELDVNNSRLLQLDIYKLFLKEFLEKSTSKAFKSLSDTDSYHASYLEFQLNEINGIFTNTSVINYLSYYLFKNHIKFDGIKDYEILYPLFLDLCNDSVYLSDINNDLKAWEHLQKGMPTKDFRFINPKGDSLSLSDFKGKYLYIDIWASWCSPCLDEIPYLKKLKESFKDENIEILSISVDNDKLKWQKALENFGLNHNQYYAGMHEILRDFYKIKGIPRFMIIDKEFNIISVSTNRPSMNIEEKLNSIIVN